MPQVIVKVKSDTKELKALRARYKKLDDWSTQAGFYQEQRHPKNGESAADVAHNLNFGNLKANIPRRPFIEDGAEDSLIELKSMFSSAFYNFVEKKKTPREVLKPMGEAMARWIANRIMFNNYISNAQYTVEKKGFDRPLYESGWLAENVRVKTRRKNSE